MAGIGDFRHGKDASGSSVSIKAGGENDAHRVKSKWYQKIKGHLTLKVSQAHVASFCRQLSILIDVGVPLLQALQKVEEQTSDLRLKRIIREVAEDIELGGNFSDALAKYPNVFSSLVVNIVKVAERGGILDNSLRILSEELEKREEIKGKVKRALMYPVIVLGVGLIVVIIILTNVVPTFVQLFQAKNVQMPLPTRLLIGFGNAIQSYWWLIILIIAALVGIILYYKKTFAGKLVFDSLKLKLPLVGSLLTKATVATFAQTLGTLLSSGVPILKALKIVEETTENSALAQVLERTRDSVEGGGKIEVPLRQGDIFPTVAIDMIAVGEEAGRLEQVLLKISNAYKEEVDHTIANFSTVIEPILLLIMGLLVAVVVYAVFLPYFSLYQVFQ